MSQSPDTPSSKTHRVGWARGLAVFAAICGLVVAVAFFSFRNELSPNECEQLEAKKNIAIGYLENGPLAPHRPNRLPQADALFVEIGQLKPDDPLAPRNLAITRLLNLQVVSDPAMRTLAAAQAREAAQNLVAADDRSAVSHLLAGKIAAAAGDESQAAAELSRAAEIDAADATLWYELFDFLKGAKVDARRKKAPEALGHAFRAAPENLALEISMLEVQAAERDANIKQTVEALINSLTRAPGLAANVAARSNGLIADPRDWLAQATGAAARGDWTAVQRLVRPLANLLRPEPWTQSDLRRLERHPLEYVIHDFQTPCPTRAEAHSPAPTEIKLSELPPARQPPALVGIADMVLADFDLDEQLDIIVLRERAVEVYARRRGGSGWRRIADAAIPTGFQRLLAADLDRDDPQQPGAEAHRQNQVRADLDIVIYGPAGIRFLRNELNDDQTRTLVEAPLSSELGDVKNVSVAIAADFYPDGDLDIALAAAEGLRLWSNRGDLTFTDITGRSQLPPGGYRPAAMVAVDWDRDIDLDLLTTDGSGQPAGYLENLRHGQFRWRPLEPGFDALQNATAFQLFDAEESGSWNLVSAGASGANVIQTDTSRAGVVTPKSNQQASRAACEGLLTWDFNNDGNLDLLTWAAKAVDFFQGASGGGVVNMPPLFALAPANIRACRSGDLDGDGDEDLAVAEAGRVVLYANEGGNKNAWIDVELKAGVVDAQTMSFRANHYGLGSVIEVRSGSRLQRRLVTLARSHFGLGDGGDPDSIRVIWTTGVPQNILEPSSKTVVCDEQVLLGSCPYLYTWSGERFEFCTDCLWSAPLGLLLAEGQTAPSRSWEYLRIDGDRLQERDGSYPLRITDELWEAAYFDAVRLIAVDHPADVEVYSNEKVGPAEIAQHKVHTVRKPRRPVTARDQQGRNLLDSLLRRDGVYAKAFDRRLAFGHAEDHFIELDFGQLDNPRQIMLFLTGWIFPSGTSMNVAISQNPGLKPPAPPSLWAPDAEGQWRQMRPYIGFPGGKTKTIAVDLTDLFLCDDYRLRVSTNMEIYWDEAFITVDEAPAEVRQTPLNLIAADIHYRGFSSRSPGKNFGHEQYDYGRVTKAPKWPAMRGHFTRYGDVRELLTESDDKLAVLGSGDELALRFAAPPSPPPPGWKRDFLLYNVGWDKDCDLNTVYGETVEPLPRAAGGDHPYAVDGAVSDAAGYQHYLQTYQTRTQDPVLFWRP